MEKQVLRGFIANVEVIPPLIVTFQYNPDSISDSKEARYSAVDTLSEEAPGKVYTGGGDRTIRFDIKLHGLEKGSNALNPTGIDNGISTELAKLRSFMYPKADAWGTFGGGKEGKALTSPPTCIFGFGTRILECVVTSMEVKETQFNSALAPVRAAVTLTLVVIEEEGNKLYTLDKWHRNILAALGLQNIRAF